jgi:hypothetical protein
MVSLLQTQITSGDAAVGEAASPENHTIFGDPLNIP